MCGRDNFVADPFLDEKPVNCLNILRVLVHKSHLWSVTGQFRSCESLDGMLVLMDNSHFASLNGLFTAYDPLHDLRVVIGFFF